MLEKLLWRKFQTGLVEFCQNLNTDHAVAAQIEEVVVNSDLFDPEGLLPNPRNRFLEFVLRRDIVRRQLGTCVCRSICRLLSNVFGDRRRPCRFAAAGRLT